MKKLELDWSQSTTYPKSNGLKVFGTFICGGGSSMGYKLAGYEHLGPYIEKGDQNLKFADAKYRNKTTYNAFFSTSILYDDVVANTLTSNGTTVYYDEKRNLNDTEYRRISTFPVDYDFCGADVRYVCGMSVPPLMIARLSEQIRLQWFK